MSGELIDVSIAITKVSDDDSDSIGYLVIYTDVGEQKEVDEQLQKDLRQYRRLIKSLVYKKDSLIIFLK